MWNSQACAASSETPLLLLRLRVPEGKEEGTGAAATEAATGAVAGR